ncbi:MAG TPA: MarR family transcriptional regulator [Candidatus Saccharimonadia bacterium]|nr:MarR family transcriptional regulator [Candidatus Saccharimonadia bacterium]
MDTSIYTDPHQSLGFLLHQAAINWRRSLAKELRAIGLTPVQFFMLGSTSRLTAEFGQAPMQRDIAENTLVDINVVSQVVRQLEKRGLLLRARNQADRRAFRLLLSEDGRETLRQAIQVVYQVDEEFFGTVTAKPVLAENLKMII